MIHCWPCCERFCRDSGGQPRTTAPGGVPFLFGFAYVGVGGHGAGIARLCDFWKSGQDRWNWHHHSAASRIVFIEWPDQRARG